MFVREFPEVSVSEPSCKLSQEIFGLSFLLFPLLSSFTTHCVLGYLSQKDNIVFGKGRNMSVDTWLLLGHTVDARVNRRKCISLRVFIQSWNSYEPVVITLDEKSFDLTCFTEFRTRARLPVQRYSRSNHMPSYLTLLSP